VTLLSDLGWRRVPGESVVNVPQTAKEVNEMSNAYVVGHLTVKNADKWAEYRNRVPATLEPWRAELVFRGKNWQSLQVNTRTQT